MALNLKQWLAGLFGLMLVLALAQGGLALVKLDAVAARTTLLLDDTIPSVNAAHGINATIIRTRLWQFRYVTAESDTARAESLAKVAEFANDRNGQIELYRARVSSAAEQKVYDDLLAKLALLKPDWDRLRAFPAERHDEAMAFFRGPMNANYLAVSGAARALVDVNLA
ncbi:MCP four helix bundle domain-containing protein, partial [Methylobacterium hispanicum]